jgi:thiamine monophosphate kinase
MLNGGEDYILLCTVSPGAMSAVSTGFEEAFGRPLYWIGEITAGDHIELVGKGLKTQIVSPRGWNHFPKEPTNEE